MTEPIIAQDQRESTTEQEEAHAALLEAAKAALKWLEAFDEHAPSEWVFGGEGRVRKQLRRAIRRAGR